MHVWVVYLVKVNVKVQFSPRLGILGEILILLVTKIIHHERNQFYYKLLFLQFYIDENLQYSTRGFCTFLIPSNQIKSVELLMPNNAIYFSSQYKTKRKNLIRT